MRFYCCCDEDEARYFSFLARKLKSNAWGDVALVYTRYGSRAWRRRTLPEKTVRSELMIAASSGDLATEQLVREQNLRPFRKDYHVSAEAMCWSVASYDMFMLNPVFATKAPLIILETCLKQPTDFAFSVVHSEAIEVLAKHHYSLLDGRLCSEAARSNDSRALYALRMCRWIADWDEVQCAVFCALIHGPLPKRFEALCVLENRATPAQILRSAHRCGLALPDALLRSADVKSLAHGILKLTLPSSADTVDGSLAYGISLCGTLVTRSTLVSIVDVIKCAGLRNRPDDKH